MIANQSVTIPVKFARSASPSSPRIARTREVTPLPSINDSTVLCDRPYVMIIALRQKITILKQGASIAALFVDIGTLFASFQSHVDGCLLCEMQTRPLTTVT